MKLPSDHLSVFHCVSTFPIDGYRFVAVEIPQRGASCSASRDGKTNKQRPNSISMKVAKLAEWVNMFDMHRVPS